MKFEFDEKQIAEIFAAVGKGATIREYKGVSDRELESVYALGMEYYKAGKWSEAEKAFHFLVILEHTSSKYWMAYGAVQQAQKRWADAVKCYRVAAFLDLKNPKPPYYAAECFLASGEKDNALMALACVERYAQDDETGRRFRAKAAELKVRVEAEAK